MTQRVHGVGLGLRWEFLDEVIERTRAAEAGEAQPLPVDFLEISPENYMHRGGRYASGLAWLAERYPIVTHGLTMSLGATAALDQEYLTDLARLLRALSTPWHSDHLCFTGTGGRVVHNLLPVAFKRDNVVRIGERIRRARDVLGLPLAIENVSYYWHPGRPEMPEEEFVAQVCAAADCLFLLDVNNLYVNATNFGWNLDAWFASAPLERVVQVHVAGHEWFQVTARGLGEATGAGAPTAMIVDTHGADTPPPVLTLLERVLQRTGPVPVLLERDENIPSLDRLLHEVDRLRAIWRRASRFVLTGPD